MLPKQHRLPLRSIPDFFPQAEKRHNRFFTIFYKPTSSLSQATIIVPKKGVSAASKRTYLKRQVREILRPLVVGTKGIQLAVVMKSIAGTADLKELSAELKKNYDYITKNISST